MLWAHRPAAHCYILTCYQVWHIRNHLMPKQNLSRGLSPALGWLERASQNCHLGILKSSQIHTPNKSMAYRFATDCNCWIVRFVEPCWKKVSFFAFQMICPKTQAIMATPSLTDLGICGWLKSLSTTMPWIRQVSSAPPSCLPMKPVLLGSKCVIQFWSPFLPILQTCPFSCVFFTIVIPFWSILSIQKMIPSKGNLSSSNLPPTLPSTSGGNLQYQSQRCQTLLLCSAVKNNHKHQSKSINCLHLCYKNMNLKPHQGHSDVPKA